MPPNQPQPSGLNLAPENPLEHLDFQPQSGLTLLEKIRSQTSQLQTASYLINELPESKEIKKRLETLISFFSQNQVNDSAINLKHLLVAVSKIQLTCERYQKKYADSFESSVPLPTIKNATDAILQSVVVHILKKEALFSREPISCGRGDFNLVFTDSDQVVYIPRSASYDSLSNYQQIFLCLNKLSEIDSKHPRINRVGSDPFPYAIGNVVKTETVSAIFQSPDITKEVKIEAANAVGRYLQTAALIEVEGYGDLDVKSHPQQKVIGTHTTWSRYIDSLFGIHLSPTTKSAEVVAKVAEAIDTPNLAHVLLAHTRFLHESKLNACLIFPDTNPSNFAIFRDEGRVCSTDWDCARVSTRGEMACQLYYGWGYLKESAHPLLRHVDLELRRELVRAALRSLVPDQDQRTQVKLEGHS